MRCAFGSAVAALAAEPIALAEATGLDPSAASRVLREARAADVVQAMDAADACGARVVLADDPEYPALLSAGVDAPELLFVRGALGHLPEIAVAIVGSRRATGYGRMQAGRIAVELAERGITIVSGGARGIDAEAHRGAMRAGGRTIAVLAAGVREPYPPEHAPLFDAIVQSGGATVTEHAPFVVARPEFFPRRNRIIAAISLVTVVVEAASRSGALLTARLAVDDYARDAACLPGPVDNPSSEGCHRAIREGWAQLVTGADDICEMLAETRALVEGAMERAGVDRRADRARRRTTESAAPRAARRRGADRGALLRVAAERPDGRPMCPGRTVAAAEPASGTDAAHVLRSLREDGPGGLDELEARLGWPVPRIATAALELELSGAARRAADGALAAC